MTKRVVVVRHGDDPPDDRVYTWLVSNGFEVDLRKPFAGELLGHVDETVVGSIIHGGKYFAYDHVANPFLKEEDRWIGECIAANIPMLGICQGAQQIAHHLGADVGPLPGEEVEFGYYPVSPTEAASNVLNETMWFTQAHFHTFGIPEGAVLLGSSELCQNQAFQYGDKVFGFQFHPEVTIEGFRRWQKSQAHLYDRSGAQTHKEQTRLGFEHDQEQAEWFSGFLSRLLGSG